MLNQQENPMANEINILEPDLDGKNLVIGIAMSRFNLIVTDALRDACLNELIELGVSAQNITLAMVPGALEIPLVLQTMAASDSFDALIALGAVIRGETYHFDLVANESARGITQIGLEYSIPIANAILTTENDEQAQVRAVEKGGEAARVAVEMANLIIRETVL
jgi:6,7-dimethyl-8-ribityllumazine synthase